MVANEEGGRLTRHARSGAQFLLTLASLVIVVAGLKAAKDSARN